MTVLRREHTATLLPNGRVLVRAALTARFFPARTACPVTEPDGDGRHETPRRFHTATLLANGLVLVAGGADAAAQPQRGAV
jgi:hypothetical protein